MAYLLCPGRGSGSKAKSFRLARIPLPNSAFLPAPSSRKVQIAERLAEDVKEAVRGTPVEDSKAELLKLARKSHDEQRRTVAQLIVSSNMSGSAGVRYIEPLLLRHRTLQALRQKGLGGVNLLQFYYNRGKTQHNKV